MNREYHPLPAHCLQPGARYHQPAQDLKRVRIDAPALAVMTDLRQIPAATIDLEAPVDAANRFMIRRGVRLLLVSDDERQVPRRRLRASSGSRSTPRKWPKPLPKSVWPSGADPRRAVNRETVNLVDSQA